VACRGDRRANFGVRSRAPELRRGRPAANSSASSVVAVSFGNDRRERGVAVKCADEHFEDTCEPKELRRFRVGGTRPASAEDVGLAELARKLAPVRPSPEAQAVSEYDQWGSRPY
jgi:hypothetical protein